MTGFNWNGDFLDTYGAIVGAMAGLTSRGEAQAFVAAYRAVSEHAEANIGFLAAELPPEQWRRVLEWCEVEHPFFGKDIPSAEEAFLGLVANPLTPDLVRRIES